MPTDFTTGKSIFILAIVAGCFAILWPNIFYPMLQGSYPAKPVLSTSQGLCCDVIFDNDVEAIKVMTDLCERILRSNADNNSRLHITVHTGKMNAAVIEACREAVWQKCHVNITQVLASKSGLNRSYKQVVEELRSLNSSVCLKQAFGVSFGIIGLPRSIRAWGINRPKHLRQERPPHLRPEFLHPALREKGRAIPHSHIIPKVDGRPSPMPGMRPPMGGAGHVVPPPKGSGTMGIVMPMYTIGIVVFFLYTMMKLMFKKSDNTSGNGYSSYASDPDFHRAVFGDYNYSNNEEIIDDATKLVVSAITGLVEEVNKQIRSDESLSPNHEAKNETLKEIESMTEEKEDIEDVKFSDALQDKSGIIKVLGYEMTEFASSGGKYSRPPTPVSRSTTPQNLYLPNLLPPQSQLLVSQEETQTLPSQDNEQPVILSAKVTLSLIGLPEQETNDLGVNGSSDIQVDKSEIEAKKKAGDVTTTEEVTILSHQDVYKTEENAETGEIIRDKDITSTSLGSALMNPDGVHPNNENVNISH